MSAPIPTERSIPDVNMERLIIETAPAQIRAVQKEITTLEGALLMKRALLRRILDTAVLYGVELCPVVPIVALKAEAPAAPGRTDDALNRGAA